MGMTTTEETLAASPSHVHQSRIDLDALLPQFGRAMSRLQAAAAPDLDPRLLHLVRTRASQINGCAYCVDMHTKDARSLGESEQRLYALPVWRETAFFTEAEQAALALAEAVTRLSVNGVSDDVFARAESAFAPELLAQLIADLVAINAWNRIGVTARAWDPGSYQP